LFKTDDKPSSPVVATPITPIATPTTPKTPVPQKDLQAELFDFDPFAEQFAIAFISEFSNRISDLIMNLVIFYKSDWAGVCSGAVLIIGYVLANISTEMRTRVNLRHTCAGMISLLKSPSPLIREKTGKVLGMLHEA
jgi:hypothetical protein